MLCDTTKFERGAHCLRDPISEEPAKDIKIYARAILSDKNSQQNDWAL